MSRRSASGFTLIELMIVVSVIGIVAALVIPAYANFIRNTRAAQAPNTMVHPTAATATTIGSAPPSTRLPRVRRAPSRATPIRRRVRPSN